MAISPTDPADRILITSVIATGLLMAKIVGVRGQPMPKGDIIQCIDDAETLMTEIEARYGAAKP